MPLIVIQAFPLTNFDDFCTANVFNITEEKKATYKNVTYFNIHIYYYMLSYTKIYITSIKSCERLPQKGIHLHKPKTNNAYSNLANSIAFDTNNLMTNKRFESVTW